MSHSFFECYLPLSVSLGICLIGLFGCFLPLVPACPLILIGILLHKLWCTEVTVSWTLFGVFAVITVLAQVTDYLCTYWGVRRFGASWRGVVGALLGLVIGPFVLTPLIGIVLGPVLGAILFELTGGSTIRQATKAGMGAIVGGIFAFAIRIAAASFMVAVFVWQVLPQEFPGLS